MEVASRSTTRFRPNKRNRKNMSNENEEDVTFRSSKRRLTQAMDELHLSGIPPKTPEWGSPFGQRTRLRRSKRSMPTAPRGPALNFGETFKRALDDTNVIETPVKRRRNNDSRALVLYRSPKLSFNKTFLPSPNSWDEYPKIPRAALLNDTVPIVEFADDDDEDNDVEIDITRNTKRIEHSGDDEEIMEIVIGEEGASDMTKGALITVPSAAQTRLMEEPRTVDFHSQTAILMPWHEKNDEDGDVEMS